MITFPRGRAGIARVTSPDNDNLSGGNLSMHVSNVSLILSGSYKNANLSYLIAQMGLSPRDTISVDRS